MKIWNAQYHDDDSGSGTVNVWATSKRGCQAKLAEAKAQQPVNYTVLLEPRAMDVPTKRADLVAWLNRHCDTG